MLQSKKYKAIILTTIALFVFSSCGGHKSKIQGDWIVDSTQGGAEVGMQLSRGGQAASINQSRTHYTSWSKDKKQFVLKGRRFENNAVSDFSDTFTIVHSGGDQLWLQRDSVVTKYVRMQ